MSSSASSTTATTPVIEPGVVATIHSLQSAGGQKLNGQKGLVLRKVKDDQGEIRFQVKVKGVKPINATSSIKPANLTVNERVPLPTEGGRPRGYVEDATRDDTCSILCELLVMSNEDYDPPVTKLSGYTAMAFGNLGDHFSTFTAVQVSHRTTVGTFS
jgi:hypothetical protein